MATFLKLAFVLISLGFSFNIVGGASLPSDGEDSVFYGALPRSIYSNSDDANSRLFPRNGGFPLGPAMPSIISKFGEILEENDPPGWKELAEMLFAGVESDSCKLHTLEWLRRMTAQGTNWTESSNTWALQMIDAWGKIPEGILSGHINSFGDFDECIGISVNDFESKEFEELYPNTEKTFAGRYCMTYMMDYYTAHGLPQPSSTASKSKTERNISPKRNPETRKSVSLDEFQDYLANTVGILRPIPSIGMCVPSSCVMTDVHKIVVNALHIAYTNRTEAELEELIWAAPQMCRVADNGSIKDDAGAMVVVVLISILAALGLLTGIYDYFLSNYRKNQPRPSSLPFKYMMAFSIYTNTKKWLSTRKNAEDFGCLHGIRSLTTAWVVLAHTYAVNMFVPQWNHIDMVRMGEKWHVLPVINGFFTVDTFFLMSGLLACYNILKLLDKTKGKLNVVMFYVHRYLRLTPTYAILVGIGATLLSYLGNGPYWYIMVAQEQYCKDHWWTNLLYINNLHKTNEMCNGESWYLANDMQFYILSPFIVYPIWRWPKIGLGALLVYFLASCTAVPILVWYHGTPPTTIVVRRMLVWQEMIYIRPYSRIGVFLVGVALGYLLYKTRGKKINLPWFVVMGGWMFSTATALYVIFCILPWYKDPKSDIPLWYGYFYAGVSRQLWGLAVGWVIFACIKGYGGLVNKFLSWSPFMPLGRLTFCVYLTSYHLQQMYLLRNPHPPQFDEYYLINLFFGHFLMSCMVGYICTLLFESPFMILQKLIFEGDSRKPAPKPAALSPDAQNGKVKDP